MWGKIILILGFTLQAIAALGGSEIYKNAIVLNQQISNPQVFNAQTCAPFIQTRTEYVRSRPYDHYLPKTEAEKTEFAKTVPEATKAYFTLRATLKSKLNEFYRAQTLSSECVMAIREAMRVVRTTEEMLLVYQLRNNLIPASHNNIFQGDYPQTFKNSNFYGAQDEVELKSGDLLMMRGSAVVSALIARIGDEAGMFSHIGVVYKNPQDQKIYIIESLIETGLKITTLDEWMKTIEVRVALYRYPNAEVAERSAQKLFDYYNSYKKSHNGKTVPYDFSMDLSNYNKMFCSEVAKLAYDLGTDGRMILPTFHTPLSKIKDTDFLKHIGVRSDYIFSPNDMEIDPRFDLIAEYRRPDRLLALRTQDLSMQAMFDWMNNYGYKLKFSFFKKLTSSFAILLDNLGLKDYGIPEGMPRKTLTTMGALRSFQKDILAAHIEQYQKDFIAKTGEIPTHQDLLLQLENLRKQDCLNYKNKAKDKVLFHHFLRSDDLSCEGL